MDEQIPAGPKGKTCPMHRKSMRDVCETCPLWTKLVGQDPQSGKQVNQWNCSLAWLPMLLIENSKETRSAGSAIEDMRNKIVERQDRVASQFAQNVARLNGQQPIKQIEVGNE